MRKYLFLARIAVLASVLSLSGCEWSGGGGPEIVGTWIDAFDSKIEVDSDSYESFASSDAIAPSYATEIVEFSNDVWNGGESGEGDFGYAVVRFTQAPIWNPEAEGKYTVLRWQNLRTNGEVTTMQYSEGYGVPYFDTAEAAKLGATAANGWFAFGYSEATRE